MVTRNGTIWPPDGYPGAVRLEQVGRKRVWACCGGVVVGQRSNLFGRESQARDDGCQRLAQIFNALTHNLWNELWLLVRSVAAFQPVEHRPQVALQDSALQRIAEQLFAMRLDELIEERDGLHVRRSLQQVRRSHPQQRIDAVGPVLAAVGRNPHEQRGVQTVPQMRGILVVQPHRR